ncbi:MAG: hypothetical protein GX752_04345 [Clostridium sp.]|nr:hypothetical protein [Clostridium sp.]
MIKIVKVLTLLLGSIMLFASCSTGIKGIDSVSEIFEESFEESAEKNIEDIDKSDTEMDLENTINFNIINFRTSESKSLTDSKYIIKTYDEFKAYLAEYDIIENPFFIEKSNLELLEKIDESFFLDNGLVVGVIVEPCPETIIKGENAIIKGDSIDLFIKREEGKSEIKELATRHVLFVLNLEDIENIDEVKIKTTI